MDVHALRMNTSIFIQKKMKSYFYIKKSHFSHKLSSNVCFVHKLSFVLQKKKKMFIS